MQICDIGNQRHELFCVKSSLNFDHDCRLRLEVSKDCKSIPTLRYKRYMRQSFKGYFAILPRVVKIARTETMVSEGI